MTKGGLLAVLISGALALAACGGSADREDRGGDTVEAAPAKKKPVRRCEAGSIEPLGSARIAYAAVVHTSARAYGKPGRRPFARFGRLNVNGVPTVFGVLGKVVDRRCRARWYRVQLPMKPNGITGFVRVGDVTLATVRTRILVDLSDRRVTLFRNGRKVVAATAAIGSGATPTPIGRFYVNQRLIPTDPNGPFGPGAIGVSAFSEVLTGWTQGGPIAIHGTNEPSSIGRAVSNGCVRIPNPILKRMFASALAGTPVVIRA